ncbi:hypothetical protein [Sabulicella rubraurantiaca]|uniref:hypothetical protein n=1 Tax=Sabulicella rubraurantiaca TaxID=2811429 RepID=UPI001A960D71|nr:hypothetical protein [Sabulicella rubraurantiaca]
MRHLLLAGLAAPAVSTSAQAQALRLDEFEMAPARRSEPAAPAPQTAPRAESRTQGAPSATQPRPQAQPSQPRPARQSAPRDAGPWPTDILVLMRRAVPNMPTPAPVLCVQPGHTQIASRASAAHGIPAHALDPHTSATNCTILAGSNEWLVETLRRSRMHIALFVITRDTRAPGPQALR